MFGELGKTDSNCNFSDTRINFLYQKIISDFLSPLSACYLSCFANAINGKLLGILQKAQKSYVNLKSTDIEMIILFTLKIL